MIAENIKQIATTSLTLGKIKDWTLTERQEEGQVSREEERGLNCRQQFRMDLPDSPQYLRVKKRGGIG